MTTEAQPGVESTPRRAVQNPVEEKPEVAEAKPSSNERGLGLTSGSLQDTLDLVRERTRAALEAFMPEPFGSFMLRTENGDIHQMSAARRPGMRSPAGGDPRLDTEETVGRGFREPRPDPETARVERTRIWGTGSGRDTGVEIRYGKDDKPFFVRDHLGEWHSSDGGKTWQTDGPNFRTRRGEVSIDSSGNYTVNNADYGVKQINAPDGSVTRTITNSSGDTFSVTRDKKGVPTAFSDKSGEWVNDGSNWTNKTTGEKKSGTVALTEYGEFRFKPNKGDATVAQTPQYEQIQRLQRDITEKYGVQFAKPGEKKDLNPPGTPRSEAEPPAIAGVPTVAELETLGNVLRNTPHENYKDMKMWFIRPDENQTDTLGAYTNDRMGGHQGCACHGKGLKRTDGDMMVFPMARQETKGVEGLEGTLYHELGHHEQFRRFTTSMAGETPANPDAKKLMEDMGWQYSPRHKEWLLKDDSKGLWKFGQPKGPGEEPMWRWVGGEKPPDNQKRLYSDEMRERALVKPITSYFDNPGENHAEALAMFRIGVNDKPQGGRQFLATESPKLYEVTKNYDQKIINDKFGKNSDGSPRMVRDLDGRVVENTEAVRARIQRQEEQWRWEIPVRVPIPVPRRR